MSVLYFCKKCRKIDGVVTVRLPEDATCEYIQALLEFHFASEHSLAISDDPSHANCVDLILD